ncbi:cryptochrome-1 [Plakobranchus ocellatus]|uniref:Cryptochrome-1 n=1 Tax=Plakobranchus ocellatus TaxID=259542 RepID=A0AAV4BMA6_9GAST|nr:cryptochrome-1 [Plakobranchus ocellatus]
MDSKETDSSQADEGKKDSHITVHWFRHGLRLHDNPALLEGLKNCKEFYPIFILDGHVAGVSTAAFPRMQFLFETLEDLDNNLQALGTRLYFLKGDPVEVFEKLFEEWDVTRVTFEQDPEPIWQDRDSRVKELCNLRGVECIEKVGHTLWDPHVILQENGGNPPLTYAAFNQVVGIVGLPEKPLPNPDFEGISLPVGEDHDSKYGIPSLKSLGVEPESAEQASPHGRYLGGETKALKLLLSRLEKERKAFELNLSLPNQLYPDLVGMPMSLSPHLRFGSLSIRKFYWALRCTYAQVHPNSPIPKSITSQLVWREYFYCMSVNNPLYNRMEGNPICLRIDWYNDEEKFKLWKEGRTGFPWIDACMRQLVQEGWIHHVCRHAVACFLTRGDLWIDWQKGLEVFDRYLLDADWSVCAGSWMWVSSSAFEKVLQCPRCICPVRYGRRMDPTGNYIRRFVPELKDMPLRYLCEPWKAPQKVQEDANCVIGVDYPLPMVNHKDASKECKEKMDRIKNLCKDIPHMAPTNENEVLSYMWLDKSNSGAMEESLFEACSHLSSVAL